MCSCKKDYTLALFIPSKKQNKYVQAAKRPIRDVAVGTGEEVKVEGMVELLQCVAHTPAEFGELEVPFR